MILPWTFTLSRSLLYKKKITFIQDPCLHFENLFVNDIEKSTLLLRVYVSQVDSTEA
jgi:hypothetical protein